METIELDSDVQKTGFTELWLHLLWKENRFSEVGLTTENGKNLVVLSTGWYNRGWGPDFSEARIQIEGDEFFGDIEIHIDESSWQKHRHHFDETYNKVILHVFFTRDHERAVNQLGQTVCSLDLGGESFDSFWETNGTPFSVPIKELPGACGLFLTEAKYRKIKNLIFQASEQRLIRKSEQLLKELRHRRSEELEDVLFASVCKSVGYSAYAERFVQLAYSYPYSEILKLFRSLHRQSRIEILGRWLGFFGILDAIDSRNVHDDLRREWMALQQFWKNLVDNRPVGKTAPKKPSRPLNDPLRRLTGLYYHLEKIQFQGLVKSWLKFFQDCRQKMENNTKCLPEILELLDTIFPQPDWDPLNHMVLATSRRSDSTKLRLIGKQRQLIVLVNSILPFFLAWATLHGNKDLEKTLFSLFLILPAEGKNRKTRFMEQRLFQIHPKFTVRKNLSYHQGLIQLHDDCCRSFYEGCDNCSLMRLMR
ncbi:MAG: DUF2851 family protein [Proteobacteria bacterium]|nr:DUF2851 family protein [Pseudomonadota bacterium]